MYIARSFCGATRSEVSGLDLRGSLLDILLSSFSIDWVHCNLRIRHLPDDMR